jgi:peptidoglycan/xylan/chitin deacetylase (PgdA/CDA1 family)
MDARPRTPVVATALRSRAKGRLASFRRTAIAVLAIPLAGLAWGQSDCKKPVYLTLDTGHMAVAPFIADTLRKHQVKATFFAAHERTQTGDGSLGEHWAPWWRERGQEGHSFASHTFDHVVWRADLSGGADGAQFLVQPSAGSQSGRKMDYSAAQYCAQLKASATRLSALTGEPSLPLFRAPGGKTSPALLAAARACGFAHVGWADAGFLGDELPSEKFSNPALLAKALRNIRSGDILMAHLGIWSRKDAWAPAVLEPLIVGLKERGFCFATLRSHPDYLAWIAAHPR